MFFRMTKFAVAASMATLLAGCETAPSVSTETQIAPKAELLGATKTTDQLRNLPRPNKKIEVAVYSFPDLTGQNKPSDGNFADLSRAVTQGGDAILVDVLFKAGAGSWFKVVERRGIQNLLRERQLIQSTRAQFQGEDAQPLPPITFAGVLIEGGIVAYETNEATGGAGARLLGIGRNAVYKVDRVTVSMRMVSVTSGEVLVSTTTTKNIYSRGVQNSSFVYVSSDAILETEFGNSSNDLPQFAVREAMELGVYAMIIEGAKRGLWAFRDRGAQSRIIANYNRALGDGSRVIYVQNALKSLGYEIDNTNGRYSDQTKAQIRKYRNAKNLSGNVLIDDALINSLIKDTNSSLRSSMVAKALLNPPAPLVRSRMGSIDPIVINQDDQLKKLLPADPNAPAPAPTAQTAPAAAAPGEPVAQAPAPAEQKVAAVVTPTPAPAPAAAGPAQTQAQATPPLLLPVDEAEE